MKTLPHLDGQRLVLRPFTPADAPEVQRLAGDRAIADTTASMPHPYLDGMAEQWISGHEAEFDSGRGLTLAVTQKSDGALVGAISLMGMSAGHQAEMGYWIGTPYWNRGYCTEAARILLRFAFGELGLIRVHACHFARNPSSGRVMQKLGMQHEGTRRKHVKKWDQFEDLVLYGILKEDWERAAS
jgi:[ribosomal protein S5]-alanine N-acetyltransferase